MLPNAPSVIVGMLVPIKLLVAGCKDRVFRVYVAKRSYVIAGAWFRGHDIKRVMRSAVCIESISRSLAFPVLSLL